MVGDKGSGVVCCAGSAVANSATIAAVNTNRTRRIAPPCLSSARLCRTWRRIALRERAGTAERGEFSRADARPILFVDAIASTDQSIPSSLAREGSSGSIAIAALISD